MYLLCRDNRKYRGHHIGTINIGMHTVTNSTLTHIVRNKVGVYWDMWPMLQYLSHQSILNRHTSRSGLKAYILKGSGSGTPAEIAINASGITRPLKCGGISQCEPT